MLQLQCSSGILRTTLGALQDGIPKGENGVSGNRANASTARFVACHLGFHSQVKTALALPRLRQAQSGLPGYLFGSRLLLETIQPGKPLDLMAGSGCPLTHNPSNMQKPLGKHITSWYIGNCFRQHGFSFR
jgi:hypothetical protein